MFVNFHNRLDDQHAVRTLVRNRSTPVHGWPGLQTIADRERAILAPYAMHSANSAGRKYEEHEHPYRSPFQRDRDRILHSAACRRLADKTQVFTGGMGDYHRTRLTHTLEVASIARTIGRALSLNEDLIEALALLHDIGHPPFGHAGEDALDECLEDMGGFSHNRYALCIVEELEIRYQEFPGLNLSYEVLDGQATRADRDTRLSPLLEVQVVDIADSITYDSHDTDDAVEAGLVTLGDLFETTLVRAAVERVQQRAGHLDEDMLRKAIVHELIDWQVGDVLLHNGQWLEQRQPNSASEIREKDFYLSPSPNLASSKRELEAFLYERVYRHPRLARERARAQDQLREMFSGYMRRQDLLPPRFQVRAEQVGLERSVGDYLAGMTDRYCQRQYHRLFASWLGGASGHGTC